LLDGGISGASPQLAHTFRIRKKFLEPVRKSARISFDDHPSPACLD